MKSIEYMINALVEGGATVDVVISILYSDSDTVLRSVTRGVICSVHQGNYAVYSPDMACRAYNIKAESVNYVMINDYRDVPEIGIFLTV